jgi:hypothetical protein
LNFFFTERPWVPPSRTRETLPLECLVTTTTRVPAGTSEQAIQDVRAREAARACELAPQEYLLADDRQAAALGSRPAGFTSSFPGPDGSSAGPRRVMASGSATPVERLLADAVSDWTA